MGKFFSLPSNPNRSSENTDRMDPTPHWIMMSQWVLTSPSTPGFHTPRAAGVPRVSRHQFRGVTGQGVRGLQQKCEATCWPNTPTIGGGRELHIIYITWNAQILSVCFKECWHFHMQVKPSLWTRFDCYYHPGRFHKASFSSVLLNLMATTFLFLAH